MSALAVALLLGVWELAPRAGWVREQSVPPCSDVAREAASLLTRPEFLDSLASSGVRWAAGFALAVLVGVPLGAWMGRSRRVRGIVDPLLALGYPVPKAALILLFVLWFGAGDVARVGIVVTGCLIPIVISAMHGAAGVPTQLLWAARSLGRRHVILLAALPQILSGLRIAIAVAIFTVLASELLIRGSGVGAFMFDALDNGQTVTVFAVAAIVAVLGFALDAVYVFGVRRALPWLEGEL
jgi:ABC-type nitrate/sulfonate/bicarbonate transport system permease component